MLPEDVVFFLDRNMGSKVFPQLLRDADLQIEVHDAHFAQDTPDADWLRVAGERGWVVVTADRQLKYNQVEWSTMLTNKVKAFAFTSKNQTAKEMAQAFLEALPEILRLLEDNPDPFIATILKSGAVRIWKKA